MLDIFAIILPIFLLIGLGYIAVKTHLVKVEAIPSIANIVLYFAIPATVFMAISKTQFSEVVEPYFLLGYALASFSALWAGLLVRRFLFGDDLAKAAISALGMSLPNSMFIGYPMLLLVFPGKPLAIALVMAVLVENLLTLPASLILLEVGKSHGQGIDSRKIWRLVGLRIVKNPLMIAIVSGLLASMINLQLPSALDQTLVMLAKISATLALFFIGASLASNTFRGNAEGAVTVVVGKLVLHPLLAALFIWLLPDFDPVLQYAMIIISAVPMLAIYPVIGERYGFRSFCANTLLVATIAGFFSLSVVLGLLGVTR